MGEEVPDDKGGGVVRAQHPQAGGQEFFEGSGRTHCIPRLPPKKGEIVPGVDGVAVIGTEVVMRGVDEVAVVLKGGGDLTALHEADAGAVQHRMAIGAVQRALGLAGQDGGVGA